ncbi:MAG TPA: hypothetical protein DCY13_02935 [Verrucomicrobiales bacterium]|nr:hypothetical protein [Verrucomicrobiales bacterium]
MNSQTSNDGLPTSDAILASGRWAFLGLFGGAALWLAVAGILGLLASLQMHKPDLFADCAWFTYGRLKAAATGAFNFGFAVQAAVGVALWLVAILGRTLVKLPFFSMAAGKLWNIGVLVGVIGVLYGDSTGVEGLEFPRYAAGVLLFGYIGMAVQVFVTFHNRNVRDLHPSVWFVIGGLFWFAWLYSTAVLLIHVHPVRGILIAAVQGWFGNGFFAVGLLPIAIAVLVYLMPALSGGQLPSRATLVFSFWLLAFLGPWGGIATGTPLPSWVGATSTALSGLFILPILGVLYSVGAMRRPANASAFESIAWKFMDLSFRCLLLWGVLTVLNTFPLVYRITQFTHFTTGMQVLALYGVVATALFAAGYLAMSKLTAPCAKCALVATIHLHVTRVGILVTVIALLVAGLQHGMALNAEDLTFAEISAESAMMFRMSTLGELLLAMGGLVFLLYVAGTTFRTLMAEWSRCEWCAGNAKPAEVAS